MRYLLLNLICYALFLFGSYSLIAQQTINSVWHFGQNCKVDFSSGSPVVGLSEIYTNEGSSSISDINGQNLFYTDGSQVWLANDTPLLSDQELLGGGSSSTQSSLIIPCPGSPSKYYIFTTAPQLDNMGYLFGQNTYHGVNASLLDLAANGGNAAFEYSNTVLLDSSCEKLTAVKSCGQDNYWVIAHKWNSNAYYAWNITSSGISQPVISSIGNFIPNTSFSTDNTAETIGFLKASSDGKKIAAAQSFRTPATIELFDFDFTTGILSNPISEIISTDGSYFAYGICFSPDDTKLYVGEINGLSFDNSKLVQYNAQPLNTADFASSRTLIQNVNFALGAIEIGPDNKLYVAKSQATSLGVINAPNLPASQCDFQLNGLPLDPFSICTFGLQNVLAVSPNDINSNLILEDTIASCENTIELMYTLQSGQVSWSTGDTTYQTTVSNEGFYYLEVSTECATVKDTVFADFKGDFTLDLPADTLLCLADSLLLQPIVSNPNLNFTWSSGQTSIAITIADSGKYVFEMTDNVCIKKDSIVIDFKAIPPVDLGPDLILCNNEKYILGKSIPNVDYLWSTGNTASTQEVTTEGEYWLKISNLNCEASDTVVVQAGAQSNKLNFPNVFSPNGDLINDEFVAGDSLFTNYSMTIYNRWGDKMFESTNPNVFWNGEYNETEATDGVYMWVCSYFNPCSSSTITRKGSVSLLR